MTTFAITVAVLAAMVLLIAFGFAAGYTIGKTDGEKNIQEIKAIAHITMAEGDKEIRNLKNHLRAQRAMEEFYKKTP